jgi:acyl-CoA synthetase (AMP-forming)/AMP-acid ligase II
MAHVTNLGRLLSDTARLHGERHGLRHGDRAWTWRQLDDRANALVVALGALGVGKGDRILVLTRNCPQMLDSMWAAFKMGAIWVPTNYRLTPGEVAWLGEDSGARVMVYGDGYAAHVDAVKTASPALRTVIAIGPTRPGEHGFDDLVDAHMGASFDEASVAYDDPVWFFYTSGTTGRSKGAVLTHGQMTFVVNNQLADILPGTTCEDVSLVVAPLSHGAGVQLLPQAARGAMSILPTSSHFDIEECWRLVAEHRVTNMFTVPTILKMMVEHPSVDRHDHSSLRYMVYAGAPMYREDQKLAINKLGNVLVQFFGLGEVTCNITVMPPSMHTADDNDPKARIGTCGYARTGMEIAAFDAEGRRLGPGEQGELCTRGPAVFAGYHNNPEATAEALKDGWFHTGDLGHVDAEGFVYITGRASDMYISGGSNIYPREIEEALLTHPAVEEVAVLGVPDPKWGEAGVAVVVRASGSEATPEQLLATLEGKIARYKIPRRVFFWEQVPKSGYGKVPKNVIRQQLFERGDLVEGESP